MASHCIVLRVFGVVLLHAANSSASAAQLLSLGFDDPHQIALKSIPLTAPMKRNSTDESIVTDIKLKGLGSFFTQVSTTQHGNIYVSSLEQKTSAPAAWTPSNKCSPSCLSGTSCCQDPEAKGKGAAACYKVEECADIVDPGGGQQGVLIGVDMRTKQLVFHYNTSICWKLAMDGADKSQNTALCLMEDGGNDTYGGVNHLHKIDLRTGKETKVADFPSNMIVDNNGGAYDPVKGIFYAMLAPFDSVAVTRRRAQKAHKGLNRFGGRTRRTRRAVSKVAAPTCGLSGDGSCVFGMDVATGEIVSTAGISGSLLEVETFDYDSVHKQIVGIFVSQCQSPTGECEDVGTLDMTGKTVVASPRGKPNLYIEKGYTQINDGVAGGDSFFITAFTDAGGLFMIGTNVTTGEVTFEIEHDSPMVDMQHYKPK
jgi:hypothetical protein